MRVKGRVCWLPLMYKEKWIQHWRHGAVQTYGSCSLGHEDKKVQLPRLKRLGCSVLLPHCMASRAGSFRFSAALKYEYNYSNGTNSDRKRSHFPGVVTLRKMYWCVISRCVLCYANLQGKVFLGHRALHERCSWGLRQSNGEVADCNQLQLLLCAIKGVTIHRPGSIYRLNDQWYNVIDAKWKNQSYHHL